MEIIELVNAYRRESDPEKKLELARLLYDDIKRDLGVRFSHKVPPSSMEDVLQETLVAVFTNLDSFRGKSSTEFRSWCNTIFSRKRSEFFRGFYDSKAEPLPPEELRLKVEESGKIEPISPEEKLDLENAMMLLEKLKAGCRQLLWKRFVAGMKPGEIAKVIGLNSDAVRMRIKRCLGEASGLI